MSTKLKAFRERLGETQEGLARKADLPLNTYRSAESGKNVFFSTASAILGAVNAILAERNEPAVTLDDLGIKLR